uniref:Ribosomal protein S18 n=2 Tax=Pavlovaceae TaxID=418969 RepID=M1K3Z0_DIALT|nr:ribosomal protein S18 [Diacronema lutheri]YP_009863834.1 ribosomal protein S18 [Pavlova sp. NIVA-4/92]AGE93811.1 ribosomal protein S18 [Diacronema lutheri]QKE31165.1 ribosomal protein S18 [Pavlova sp. NIVA-4/92]
MRIDKSKIEKEVLELEVFTTHQGKVLHRRMTKLNVQEQKKIQRKVKLARALSFMPYVRREG